MLNSRSISKTLLEPPMHGRYRSPPVQRKTHPRNK